MDEENKFYLSNALKETIREKADTGKNQFIFVGIVDENDTDYYYYRNTAKDGLPMIKFTVYDRVCQNKRQEDLLIESISNIVFSL